MLNINYILSCEQDVWDESNLNSGCVWWSNIILIQILFQIKPDVASIDKAIGAIILNISDYPEKPWGVVYNLDMVIEIWVEVEKKVWWFVDESFWNTPHFILCQNLYTSVVASSQISEYIIKLSKLWDLIGHWCVTHTTKKKGHILFPF